MKVNEKQWRATAARQYGASAFAQLLDAGLSPRQVGLRVRRGEIVRTSRGVYCVSGAPETFEQKVMAACLAADGFASHRCAAAIWGLRGCETKAVEITVLGRRQAELPGVTTHTTASLPDTDVTERLAC